MLTQYCTMATDVFPIPVPCPGTLMQMPHPKGGSSLPASIECLRQQGVHHLVSMLRTEEAQHLGLEHEEALFVKAGGRFTSFAIPDLQLPDNARGFLALADELANQLRGGAVIAVHCRAGIGRSGMLSCATLVNLGFSIADAQQHVSEHRGHRVPETPEQVKWLQEHLTENQE
ncbi:MAG: protein-tyrosine phosphatase family protein [Pseudomonadota bacterium]